MINGIINTYQDLDAKYAAHMRIARFLISGGMSALVDFVLLYLFTDIIHVWYVASAVIAFIVSFFVSFGLQKYWTFRDHSNDRIVVQGASYLLLGLINLVVNTALVYAFTDWLGLYYMLSQFIAAGLVAVNNYFIYKRLIFKSAGSDALASRPAN